MSTAEGIDLVRVLVWPCVVLVSVKLLRRELTALFGRVRQIEGPGSLKVSLDASQVEQIILEGQRENKPPNVVAERILEKATVLESREARILRALFDDAGRAIFNYQTDYYRPALQSLISKGLVRKANTGFELTEEGQRVTREYLLSVLRKMEKVAPASTKSSPAS